MKDYFALVGDVFLVVGALCLLAVFVFGVLLGLAL